MKKSIVLLGCCLIFSHSMQAQLILQGNATAVIKGNVTSTTDIGGSGTLSLQGTAQQSVNLNGHAVSSLELNNTAGAVLTGDLQIGQLFTFTNGKFLLNAFNLTSNINSVISQASSSAFFITNSTGQLIKNGLGNTAFTYPVGSTGTAYHPVTLSNTGTEQSIGVRSLPHMLSNGLTGTAYTTKVVDAGWHITSAANGSNLNITPSWYAADELSGFDRTYVSLAYYDSIAAQWDTTDLQAGAASGLNPYTCTRTGITHTGTFALGTWASVFSVINSPLTATATVNSSFSYTITATNNPDAYHASGLPGGLSIDTSSGVISGSSITTGTFAITLMATNAYGTTQQTLMLTVLPQHPVISSSSTATSITGSIFSYTITASNHPDSYAASGLPQGLSIDALTGIISGIPVTAGHYAVTLTATNAGGTDTLLLNLTIDQAPPAITSAATAHGIIDSAFSYHIIATNQPASYDASGLPAGLTIDHSTGIISGIPAMNGVYTTLLKASNAGGSDTLALIITIDTLPVATTLVLYPNPVVNGHTLQAVLPGWQGEVFYTFCSIHGMLIQSGSARITNATISLPVYSMRSGTYILRLQNDNAVVVKKIVVL